jgi:hypothetical protein
MHEERNLVLGSTLRDHLANLGESSLNKSVYPQ